MENYLKKVLNDEQFEAVKSVDGQSLILAGAGAGKTRTLTYKIAYMNYLGINSSNILAVTFTNKAAHEMKERLKEIEGILYTQVKANNQKSNEIDFDDIIEEEFKNNDIDLYLQKYDKQTGSTKFLQEQNYNWIGTFHSMFLKILKYDIQYINDILSSNYDKNFNIVDESDSLSIIKNILKDLGIKDTFNPKEIKWYMSNLKNRGLTSKDFEYELNNDNDKIIAKVYKKYEKILKEQNSLDFDDLLLFPYILFKKKPEILKKWQNKFKYILVDEAQDTNKIQFELIYMLSTSNGNITLIGDDFQSIYGRRGAVIEEFLNAKKYWPYLKIFKLQINYRSKKTIVEAGNAIILNNKNQYKKNIKAFTDKESKIKLICFSTDIDEALQVIEIIKKLYQKGKKWSDFAIIYRTNAQSEPFEKVLLTEAIPYKVYGAFKFYERKEVKDIIAYIKYIINPSDGLSLSRIINVPGRKIGDTTINKLLQQASLEGISLHDMIQNIEHTPLNFSVKNNIRGFIETINYIKEKTKNKNPYESIQIIFTTIKYEEYLKKEYGKEQAQERLSNIGQLMNVAIKYVNKGEQGLREFIDEISLFIDLEDKNQENIDQVQLMTVHSSKGLEFDTVFLVGLEENIFPLSRARLNSKELEEERRLMYVGVTRAKNNLFLTYAESRKQYGNLKYNPISRFIQEIPEDLVSSFNGILSSKKSDFELHDKVKHKLFGIGEVMEVFQDKVIVRFYGHGIKQILSNMLEKIE